VTPALLLLASTVTAYAADTFNLSNRQLSIPSVVIGGATYSNMVVTVGTIVKAPSGTSANGSEDSYDPQTNQLTVQTVNVGSATYYNAVVTVAGLVSIGSVTGADSYGGGDLSVLLVQAGNTTFHGVLLRVGSVVSVAGGMPTDIPDTYNYPTHELAIPAVQVGNRVYTNVVITVSNLISENGVASSMEESVLYPFGIPVAGITDGANPQASLIQTSDGTFYGTTSGGGQHFGGTVFKITPSGESVLYTFCSVSNPQCTDGNTPVAGLIVGRDGNFYGTTEIGGKGYGTVFKLTPAGGESVLYSFCAKASGINGCPAGDGALPEAGVIQASDGNFYGTTYQGGAYNQGTVYQVTPAGVEKVLHSFSGNGGLANSTDGAGPVADLIQGKDGNLYGTTQFGGVADLGTVFKITTGGAPTQLYSFVRSGTDGRYPTAGLIQAGDGNFYGTTNAGGTTGGGTVYRISAAGETVLYSFDPIKPQHGWLCPAGSPAGGG
jgi:uncharacterized repeat protein (TIGR03803 family)